MIITRTPFRISFFGGGTDFAEFYKEHGGAVLSTAIDKYCYVNVRHLPRFFDYASELCYSEIERVNHVSEVKHPLTREELKMLDMHEIRLSYESDIPARSGMGTSSAFAVGMLNAFHSIKGQYMSKKQLADESIYLERVQCKEVGGIQDQIATAYGGMNKIEFGDFGYIVKPEVIYPIRKRKLNSHLMLFFTGFSRYSFEISVRTRAQIKNKEKELLEMKQLVEEAEKILTDKNKDLNDFGRLLDYNWKLKRGLNEEISTDATDLIYHKAKAAGALGGKLLGAGGGGFILLYAELDRQASIRYALNDLLYVPFKFDEEGAKVIYYEPETYVPTGTKREISDDVRYDDFQEKWIDNAPKLLKLTAQTNKHDKNQAVYKHQG